MSHETIYQGLYLQARGGPKRELTQALRTGRTVRKPRRRPDQRTSRFVDPMIMISERPAEVEDRAVPGHWEGDLIMGKPTRPRSRPWSNAPPATRCWCTCPRDITPKLSATVWSPRSPPCRPTCVDPLTWDQGCEMARHQQFAMATDMPVYFCDPASPQRGHQREHQTACCASTSQRHRPERSAPQTSNTSPSNSIGRPRKTLDWDTPAERLRDSTTASLTTSVATTPETAPVFRGGSRVEGQTQLLAFTQRPFHPTHALALGDRR